MSSMLPKQVFEPIGPTDHPIADHDNPSTYQTSESNSLSIREQICLLPRKCLNNITKYLLFLWFRRRSKSRLLLNLLALSVICLCRDLFFNNHTISLLSEMQHLCFHITVVMSLVFISEKCSRLLRSCFGLLIVGVLMMTQGRQNIGHQSFHVEPLFEPYSLVTDYAYGELTLLKEELFLSDVTLVLFYAPWDREALEFKSHFASAALYYHEQVKFVAINCWLPGSECRKNYHLLRYPTLVMCVRLPSNIEVLNIPYGGQLNAVELIQFVKNTLQPFQYISSQEELDQVRIYNDGLVLGYIPLRNTSHLSTFYYSALARLQFSSMEQLSYAVTFNKSLLPLDCDLSQPSINLFNWNGTLTYPSHKPWNVENITDWIHSKASSPTKILTFTDRKNPALDNALYQGPVLFIATPINPFIPHHDVHLLVKSISMQYYACTHIEYIEEMVTKLQDLISLSPELPAEECRSYLRRFRNNYRHSLLQNDFNASLCDASYLTSNVEKDQFLWPSLWTTTKSDVSVFFSRYLESFEAFESFTKSRVPSLNQSMIKTGHSRYCLKNVRRIPEEPLSPYQTDELIEQMSTWQVHDKCKSWALGSSLQEPLKLNKYHQFREISGLGCSDNKTLSFVIVNTEDNKALIERFSLPRNDTAVWIVDPFQEEHYVLRKPLSLTSLSSFIGAFHDESLVRTIISSEPPTSPPGHISIQELTADNYAQVTGTNGVAHVVLHYGPECGQCRAIGHVLLACRELAQSSHLVFSRIDVTRNTLPWPYTFDSLPTIIFYPKIRKTETRVFDASNGYSVKSIMTFILKNLPADHRRSLVSSFCDTDCQLEASSRILLQIEDAQKSYDHHIHTLKIYQAKMENRDLSDKQRQFFSSRIDYFKTQIMELKSRLKMYNSMKGR